MLAAAHRHAACQTRPASVGLDVAHMYDTPSVLCIVRSMCVVRLIEPVVRGVQSAGPE